MSAGRNLVALVFGCSLLLSAAAAERVQVCAREGAGKAYNVQATVVSGQELIKATSSFAYSPFAKYVVIFWDQEHATVIELDFPVLNAIGTGGRDKQGRPWQVSTNPYCF